jgi:hypothetical protein
VGQPPTSETAENKVELSIEQLTEMKRVSGNLEQIALKMNDLVRTGSLDASIAKVWTTGTSGYRSVELDASPGKSADHVLIERAALSAFASKVEAFVPRWKSS